MHFGDNGVRIQRDNVEPKALYDVTQLVKTLYIYNVIYI